MKKRIFLSLIVGTLTQLMPTMSHAAIPSAWLQVGNGPAEYLSGWQVAEDGVWALNFTLETSDYQISGNVSALADPYISYGIAFANHTASPLLFQLGILNPMMMVSGPNLVYASYSGSGTDVGGDGFGIHPYYPDMDGDGLAEIQVSDVNGVNMGVDVGQAYSDGSGFPGHSNELGNFSSGPKAGPGLGPWTQLGLKLGFTLNGGNDIATLNGYSAIIPQVPVPEPASVLLLGVGLIGLGLVRRVRG